MNEDSHVQMMSGGDMTSMQEVTSRHSAAETRSVLSDANEEGYLHLRLPVPRRTGLRSCLGQNTLLLLS